MLHQSYDPLLVIASMLLASLAGYAALDLSARVAISSGGSQKVWIATSALAMGVGIWSMHFVAMLALDLGMAVVYNIPLLVISIAVAVTASAITFTGAAKSVSTNRLAIASLAMGPAIAGMHYTGMASMRMAARLEYNPILVALSVVIAVSASFAALVLARYFRHPVPNGALLKIMAAVVMGAAVYGMHYTGMLAAHFIPIAGTPAIQSGVISTGRLGWAIAIAGILIIGLALLAAVADRRLDAAQFVASEADRERTRVVDTLQQIGKSLASELDLSVIVQSVTDVGTQLTGAQFGVFFYNLTNAAGETSTLYKVSGVLRETFADFSPPRPSAVFTPTFARGGIVRSDDITSEPRYEKTAAHFGLPAGHHSVRSFLAEPVISRTGTIVGGLFFGHEDVGVFQPRHEQIIVGIAGWASVSMDNARLFDAEKRARGDAERANRAKDDFLAVMSHELRTPLNAIIGYTDLLLTIKSDPQDVRRKLERVDLSARHLLELIDELLTYARLDAGEETIDAESVDAVQIASEVQALMEPLASRKLLAFECTAPASPLRLQSDARKIRQILLNLCSNAVKFTDDGAVKLVVDSIADSVVFRVSDTGSGIAEQHRDKIFEPFWRVETGPTRVTGGTGLGLSVSRRLAQLLGGNLTVESNIGVGSIFTLRLPVSSRLVAEGLAPVA